MARYGKVVNDRTRARRLSSQKTRKHMHYANPFTNHPQAPCQATPPDISYHPQRGWFDEGPHRGPRVPVWCRTAPPLPKALVFRSVRRAANSTTCTWLAHRQLKSFLLDWARLGSWGRNPLSARPLTLQNPWICTPERQSLAESTARGGGLPVASYAMRCRDAGRQAVLTFPIVAQLDRFANASQLFFQNL